MSEKIYAFLLRLYPARFRRAYGDEALQLFRDRSRDENGWRLVLRLWLDLLSDLAISVPREYFYAEPELMAAAADQSVAGAPSFHIVGDEAPRAGALFSGGVLSVAALLMFSTLLNQGIYRGPRHRSTAQPRALGPESSALRGGSNAQRGGQASVNGSDAAAHADSAELASGENSPSGVYSQSRGFSSSSTGSQLGESTANPFFEATNQRLAYSSSVSPTPPGRSASVSPASRSGTGADAVAATQSDSQRHRVIAAAAADLRQFYVHRDVGQQMSDSLLAHETRGDDKAADDAEFARLLTRQMRDVSHDLHLEMIYSRDPLPDLNQEPTPEEQARYRQVMQRENCGFEKVEVLAHNIGYLKLNAFPDPGVCQAVTAAAMNRLNKAAALIYDLRDNRGGQPEMVMLMASYLFDHPEYMYSPRENTTERLWTHSPVVGNLLADKPVFVLTSRYTASAAEHFTYDLKMLKRATVVGGTTGGAAHSGVFHRLDDHFGIGIPEANPINPFAKADWAVVGVQPDVKVRAEDALAAAEKLAAAQVAKQ